MPPTARYQCLYCTHSHAVKVRRTVHRFRQLWCWRCGCVRLFERVEGRLQALAWPPPAREAQA